MLVEPAAPTWPMSTEVVGTAAKASAGSEQTRASKSDFIAVSEFLGGLGRRRVGGGLFFSFEQRGPLEGRSQPNEGCSARDNRLRWETRRRGSMSPHRDDDAPHEHRKHGLASAASRKNSMEAAAARRLTATACQGAAEQRALRDGIGACYAASTNRCRLCRNSSTAARHAT